jgi:hypothetical protein
MIPRWPLEILEKPLFYCKFVLMTETACTGKNWVPCILIKLKKILTGYGQHKNPNLCKKKIFKFFELKSENKSSMWMIQEKM